MTRRACLLGAVAEVKCTIAVLRGCHGRNRMRAFATCAAAHDAKNHRAAQ